MIRHVLAGDRQICSMDTFVAAIHATTRSIYQGIDCPACLRAAIAASEERTVVLRELLDRVEGSS